MLLSRLGTRTVLPSGSVLTLGDTVVSRAGNGDYVIKSSTVYDLRVSRTGRESPKGWVIGRLVVIRGSGNQERREVLRGRSRCDGFVSAFLVRYGFYAGGASGPA